jgi:RNA polymerase sigma-70 factor (ECF subfamily)
LRRPVAERTVRGIPTDRILERVDETRRQLIALLPDLRGYARFLVRDPGEADDLVQEALARALAALGGLHDGASLRPWVLTILRNTFFEQSRRHRTERAALRHGTLEPVATEASQPSHVDLADLQRQLFALPALERDALVLVGAQGLSYEAAAAVCGVPTGTVKARVSRARARLARLLAGSLDERA